MTETSMSGYFYTIKHGGSMEKRYKIPPFWERQEAYIGLNVTEYPFREIVWKGFRAYVHELLDNGWKIRVYGNPYINKVIIKIVNPEACMVGSIKMERIEYENTKTLDLDNLHAGGTRKMRKQPQLDRMRILTEDDVPGLLATANMLLEKNRKRYIKKVKLPTENVVYLENYLSKLKA